jgi:hypothetical protein
MSSQPGNNVRADIVETTDAGIGYLQYGQYVLQGDSGVQEAGA